MGQKELAAAALGRVALVAEVLGHVFLRGLCEAALTAAETVRLQRGLAAPTKTCAHRPLHPLFPRGGRGFTLLGVGVRQTSRGAPTLNLRLLLILSLCSYILSNPFFPYATILLRIDLQTTRN